MKGAFLLPTHCYNLIYGEKERADIARLLDMSAGHIPTEELETRQGELRDVEVIFSGWGSPRLTPHVLGMMPNLKAYLYGAGTLRHVVTDEFWERSIPVCSAYAANAVPVTEFSLSQILYCLKQGWQHALRTKADRSYHRSSTVAGAFGSTVGLISMGMIGRMVTARLKSFDLNVIAYDPFLTTDAAQELGVESVSLMEVFERADVVSVHAPWLPETEKMIRAEHIRAMRPGASLLNTARGAVIDEAGLVEALRERTDLVAVLDVVWPEPPPSDSPLFDLPNIIITPHIAGSMNAECQRMGRLMYEEAVRFVNGEPLRWSISRARAATMA
ncbi:glycerate dehydrogenase [Verrucomicrobia bacterium LW23]|nr:glycerate dehydrogenase [Verrucomicrobia bacterium LW23]